MKTFFLSFRHAIDARDRESWL